MQCRRIGMEEKEIIKAMFAGVFTKEPWNDDWSDERQLDGYITDLIGQSNSLAFGLFEGEQLVGLSMGSIKHWFSGTQYCIEEFCIDRDRQGRGLGTFFLREIEKEIRELGMTQIFLQTGSDVPAYDFYKKNGFRELPEHVSFFKQL